MAEKDPKKEEDRRPFYSHFQYTDIVFIDEDSGEMTEVE